MKKNRAIVALLLTAIITVFLCYTAGIGLGPTGTGAAKNIKTGLDLSGGVSITYQAKDSNPSAEDMSDTVYKLQKRVEQYSTEAQVYKEGSDRIAVEIVSRNRFGSILEDTACILSLWQLPGQLQNFAARYSMEVRFLICFTEQ